MKRKHQPQAGIGESDVVKIHRSLEQSFRITAKKTEIRADTDQWIHAEVGSNISFALRSKDIPEITDRVRGGPQHVFRLYPDQQEVVCVWFGWREEWQIIGPRRLDLIGASMNFLWGYVGRRRKQPLFRAEWDKARGYAAAQPHWHIDHEILAGPVLPAVELPSGEGELVELDQVHAIEPDQANTSATLSATKMHLGMGGWNHSADHPECWRAPLSNVDGIVAWGERVLQLAKQEFLHLRFDAASVNRPF